MATVKGLKQLIRWDDWAFDKILPLFLIASYISLAYGECGTRYICDFLCLLVLAAASAAYGFLVNDRSDRDLDPQQGKTNAFAELNHRQAFLILGSALTLATLASLRFWQRPWFLFLWALWLLAATFYSLPPLRFKERGALGLWTPALAQFILPSVIFFAALGHFGGIDMWTFAAYVGSKGVTIAIGQQKRDLEGDLYTGTSTFATLVGYERIAQAYAAALFVEQVLLVVVLILLLFRIPPLKRPGLVGRLSPVLPLILGYVLLLFLALRKRRTRGHTTDPYFDPDKDIFNILYAIFPCGVMSFYMALLMGLHYPSNLVILFLLVLWIEPSPRRLLWPLRAVLERNP